jgi:hypothetical protein
MKKIRHSKLPITIISGDNLDIDMLEAIQLNLMYDEKKSKRENLRGWELWVDEYGEWFNPYPKDKNQLELFDEEN